MKSEKKPAAKPATTKKTATKKATKAAFPTNELKAWLKGRKAWNHNDWIALLENLRKTGYATLTDTQEGRETIGKFLEANRSK